MGLAKNPRFVSREIHGNPIPARSTQEVTETLIKVQHNPWTSDNFKDCPKCSQGDKHKEHTLLFGALDPPLTISVYSGFGGWHRKLECRILFFRPLPSISYLIWSPELFIHHKPSIRWRDKEDTLGSGVLGAPIPDPQNPLYPLLQSGFKLDMGPQGGPHWNQAQW